jgi:transketolase
MTSIPTRIDELSINTVRTLSMDAVQKANSGHPGAPMAMAPLAYTLFTKYLRFNPANPDFPNRDRFVLSAGHASMLLYSTLHLSGYDLSLADIKQFRQTGSKTPGHPEYGHAPGVETTTGPLGQGAANSVGMAIAEKWLAAHFNRPGHNIVDYRVYALLGDGCLMEGVTAEAASLAGHLKLDNLIWFYDSNRITIEGGTDLAYSDDVAKRFAAYGWQTQLVDDVEDREALGRAIEAAQAERERPSLIVVRSIIGRGAPTRQNTAKAHGEPLGPDEVAGAKMFYKWTASEPFHVPKEVYVNWTEPAKRRGAELEAAWNSQFRNYAAANKDLATQWKTMQAGELPVGWEEKLPKFDADPKGTATRNSGGKALVAAGQSIPWLIGGSADLAPSTKTLLANTGDFKAADRTGRNMRFGVREHAMAAVCNGMALSKLRSFGASFLVFADYARPAIRLSALMGLPVIYVFTHDSIGVGEDGPTHQPVEHLASLRAIPNLDVFRPGDANEAVMGWRHALTTNDRPVLMALSRQDIPTIDRGRFAGAEGALRGGYIVADSADSPEVILIGTGSELQHCMAAYGTLTAEGVRVRVVSLPCWSLFERQDDAYRTTVLPPEIQARVAIEAGSPQGWERYVGRDGAIIAQSTFGLSGPYNEVMAHFGLTAEAVVAAARKQLRRFAN